jgi:hypothetical protein
MLKAFVGMLKLGFQYLSDKCESDSPSGKSRWQDGGKITLIEGYLSRFADTSWRQLRLAIAFCCRSHSFGYSVSTRTVTAATAINISSFLSLSEAIARP